MPTTIQIRRSPAASWSASTVLADGEIGYETDTGNYKVGDGSTQWSSLVYQFPYSTGSKTSALSATLTVDNANDRVGIGTTTPAQKLDVVGNAAISADATVGGTLAVTGNTTLTGDLAVNGGDVTTTATGTATVFNTNATILNIGGAATTVGIGAATGTATINNATTAIAGAATIGGTLAVTGNTTLTGDLAVNGGDITTTNTTATVFNANATTLNVGQAATTVSIGATTGTATIRNATTSLTGDLVVGGGDITLSGTGRIQGIDTVSSGTDAASKNYVDTEVAWYDKTWSSTNPPIGTIVIASVDAVFNSGAQNSGTSDAGAITATITNLRVNGTNNVNRYVWGTSPTGSQAVSGTWKVICYMDDDGGSADHAWVMVVRIS